MPSELETLRQQVEAEKQKQELARLRAAVADEKRKQKESGEVAELKAALAKERARRAPPAEEPPKKTKNARRGARKAASKEPAAATAVAPPAAAATAAAVVASLPVAPAATTTAAAIVGALPVSPVAPRASTPAAPEAKPPQATPATTPQLGAWAALAAQTAASERYRAAVARLDALAAAAPAAWVRSRPYGAWCAHLPQALALAGARCVPAAPATAASRGQTVENTEPAELERVMSTHAFAGHYLARLVLPSMRTCERGDIVMISSAATKSFRANGAPYSMAKAALEALAYTLAKEVRADGIHVNVVAPGLVETEMGRRLMQATAGVQSLRELDERMPFSRVCQPEDVANAVRYFVSPHNTYMTGERVYVDGGGQDFRST